MDAYRHITPIERGCIMTLFNQGHSPAAIATMLKRHRCTILVAGIRAGQDSEYQVREGRPDGLRDRLHCR